MPQRYQNPNWLVAEFQKSGEFDRLRKQLQTHFLNSDQVHPLMSRVEYIAREKLSSDDNLEHKARETVFSEVMQDMERYPIVERAVSNLGVDKDQALLTSINEHLRNILRGGSNQDTKLWNAQPSSSKEEEEDDDDDDDDESSEYTEEDEPGDDDLLIITDAEREDGALLSKQPASENEFLTIHDATSSAVDEVQPPSGNTHSRSTLLNHPLPVSNNHPAPWSTPNQSDDKSSPLPSTSTQIDVHHNLPSSGGGPSNSSSSDNLPVIHVVGSPSGKSMELEQAETTFDDYAEHEISFRDVDSYPLPQADANGGFRAAEALVPALSPQDCGRVGQQRSDSPPTDDGGTFPLVSTSGNQELSQIIPAI